MGGFSRIQPSYITAFPTEVEAYKTRYLANATKSVIISSSTVNNSSKPSSGNIDMLFTWVFIACVALALLMIISIFMVIVYWKVKRRRRRTATVTDVRKGAGKERKRGRVNLRNSIKRVFISEGPLYAVSNLSAGSRYTGLPERQNNSGNPDSTRSSPEPEIIPSDAPGHISQENQHAIYQRYLSPIEGVPPPLKSVPLVVRDEDETYLQPVDELRASKRFLQPSRNNTPEPEDTYLEPLHGLPVPDVHQKPSTPKPSPKPSPKPTLKPKPTMKLKP